MTRAQTAAALPLVFMLTLLCACAESSSMEVESESAFFGDYVHYSASRSFELELTAAEAEITVSLTGEDGKIGLVIRDGDDQIVYTGRELPTSAFAVMARRPGRYAVELTLTRFTGTISLEMLPLRSMAN